MCAIQIIRDIKGIRTREKEKKKRKMTNDLCMNLSHENME